jgi:hypothetical protein
MENVTKEEAYDLLAEMLALGFQVKNKQINTIEELRKVICKTNQIPATKGLIMLINLKPIGDDLQSLFKDVEDWPELDFTAEVREGLKRIPFVKKVNNSSILASTSKDGMLHTIFVSPYILYALLAKEFAIAFYEYIKVLDGTINSLTAADSVIIPVQCEYYALEGLGKLLNTIKIIQSRLNTQLLIEGILLTMYDLRLRLSNQVVNEVNSHFKNMVFETIIPRNIRLSESPSYGIPAIMHDAESKGATSYLNLAKEIVRKNGLLLEI